MGRYVFFINGVTPYEFEHEGIHKDRARRKVAHLLGIKVADVHVEREIPPIPVLIASR